MWFSSILWNSYLEMESTIVSFAIIYTYLTTCEKLTKIQFKVLKHFNKATAVECDTNHNSSSAILYLEGLCSISAKGEVCMYETLGSSLWWGVVFVCWPVKLACSVSWPLIHEWLHPFYCKVIWRRSSFSINMLADEFHFFVTWEKWNVFYVWDDIRLLGRLLKNCIELHYWITQTDLSAI